MIQQPSNAFGNYLRYFLCISSGFLQRTVSCGGSEGICIPRLARSEGYAQAAQVPAAMLAAYIHSALPPETSPPSFPPFNFSHQPL
jgi:hypothetical protein